MTRKILIPLTLVLVFSLGLYLLSRGGNTNGGSEAVTGTVTQAVTTAPTDGQAIENEQATAEQSGLTLDVSSPVNGATVSNSTITVTGKTAPNIQVFVNEEELIADANGNFSADIELFEGENTIYVVANNNVGDYIEKEITVYLESTE